MAFRALLFSKSPETSAALSAACLSAGIRAEICSDIFAAMEKGTKQAFSCILADWSDQPEAGFLLKRARESGPNKSVVAIAIVDLDPTAAELRDNRLDFLIYRPIADAEAQEVLTKATEKMQPVAGESIPQMPAPSVQPAGTNVSSPPADSTEERHETPQQADSTSDESYAADSETEPGADEGVYQSTGHAFPFLKAAAAAVVIAAAFALWSARATVVYLVRTPENRTQVFKESIAALFSANTSGATPLTSVGSEAQQDSYFSRGAGGSSTQAPQLGVVATETDLSDSRGQLPKAVDFPLPAPTYDQPAPPPVHVKSAAIPDSLRGSASITPPVVVTVGPGQMMPVSTPAVQAPPQQFSEPVAISEESARQLLAHRVDPQYPLDAMAQKVQGSVVLQVTIGRDGSVEDLKMVRGNFILAKAAAAAVKQWRFQPYTLNGHAAQAQTVITLNFTSPAN